MVLGGRGYQGFCDDSTKALVLKSVTMGGGGVKNYQKLCDVIYGQPLNRKMALKDDKFFANLYTPDWSMTLAVSASVVNIVILTPLAFTIIWFKFLITFPMEIVRKDHSNKT